MEKTMKRNSNNVLGRGKRIVAFALSAVFLTACCPIAFAAEDSSAPLTPEQISAMTHEQLAAISQEQSDATLSKMAQLFQDGEKEALDEYLSAMGFATTYEEYLDQEESLELSERAELDPGIQPLWESNYEGVIPDKQCHEYLTVSGFLAYVVAWRTLFNGNATGYHLDEISLLAEQSEWPDRFDMGIFWDRHFYDPDTGKNFNAALNTPTAKDRAEYYYQEAISKYKAGDREDALRNLGRCIHYVEDVAVPHHAANCKATNTNHSAYEALASEMILSGDLTFDLEDTDNFTTNFYNNCATTEIGLIVHEIAKFSKQYISVVLDENNILGQKLVIAVTAATTIQYTSAVFYKFAKETGMI